jgi:hypothetical protein
MVWTKAIHNVPGVYYQTFLETARILSSEGLETLPIYTATD